MKAEEKLANKVIVHFINGETKIIEDAIQWCTGVIKTTGYTAEFNPTNYVSVLAKDNKEYLFPYSSILYVEFERGDIELVKEYH